jgi:XTP/dITP diphosphohydrolase
MTHGLSTKRDGWTGDKTLTFVTGNAGKVRELAALVAEHGFTVVQDDGGYPEIQAETLAEVAQAGAKALLGRIRPPFLLEDSGLFVDALNGFPGVYSRHALDTIGCAGLIRLLDGAASRAAEFRAHLLYVDQQGALHGFDGACSGTIAPSPSGASGFGFDPIFRPAGSARTFAEMSAEEKNRVSHRAKAVRAFLALLAKTAVR